MEIDFGLFPAGFIANQGRKPRFLTKLVVIGGLFYWGSFFGHSALATTEGIQLRAPSAGPRGHRPQQAQSNKRPGDLDASSSRPRAKGSKSLNQIVVRPRGGGRAFRSLTGRNDTAYTRLLHSASGPETVDYVRVPARDPPKQTG